MQVSGPSYHLIPIPDAASSQSEQPLSRGNLNGRSVQRCPAYGATILGILCAGGFIALLIWFGGSNFPKSTSLP
jgi:hypothetical protein